MNDPHKCARCAKAVASGCDSICVSMEKSNRINLDNFWRERDAKHRAINECDKLAGRVKELEQEKAALEAEIRGLEIQLDSAKTLRNEYKADFRELKRVTEIANEKEWAKVKRLVEAVRKWRNQSKELEDFLDSLTNTFISAAKDKQPVTYLTRHGIAFRLAIVGVGKKVSIKG